MGSFSHSCKLSGVPITGGTPAVLIVMKPGNDLYENSEKNLIKCGSTYMCSNSGTRLKFTPCWFPIRGNYDDYGGIEDIIEDDNTKVLETYYNMDIQDIMNVITGREEPETPIEKTLSKLSGMWINRDVYDKLTEEATIEQFGNNLDFGNTDLLESLGFTKQPKDKSKKRYNIPFTHGKLTVYTDGTWLDGSIYSIESLQELASSVGEVIDITPIENKDLMEQIFDVVIPKSNIVDRINFPEKKNRTDEEWKNGLKWWNNISSDGVSMEYFKKLTNKMESEIKVYRSSDMDKHLIYYFLNTDRYYSDDIKNPLTIEYLKAAKDGKLKDNLVKFWRFDHYMRCCGRFYDIVGTSPQDGEPSDVLKVIKIAYDILEKEVEERKEWDE